MEFSSTPHFKKTLQASYNSIKVSSFVILYTCFLHVVLAGLKVDLD